MNILADASLPGLNQAFPKNFKLTLYEHNEEINELLDGQDVLLCRATYKIKPDSLKRNQLQFIATASSGTDHLDKTYLKSKNITVIDAKGCNAISVADYVMSSIAYLQKQELLKGIKTGIIGLGHVGIQVQKRLKAAGFEVFPFDPLKAQQDESFQSCDLHSLYQSDLLCIHAELHHQPQFPSANLVNLEFLNRLKPGCALINASRGGIVNEKDLLITANPLIYCTDVYLDEPQVNREIVAKATLCTPHIAGHSLEAKYAAVAIVSKKLHEHIGLPIPVYAEPQRPDSINEIGTTSWQDLALSIYNPADESQVLKQAIKLDSAFVALRQQHQKRHDFHTYFKSNPTVELC